MNYLAAYQHKKIGIRLVRNAYNKATIYAREIDEWKEIYKYEIYANENNLYTGTSNIYRNTLLSNEIVDDILLELLNKLFKHLCGAYIK